MIGGRIALAIDVFAVPNPDDQDNQPIVFHSANDTEIAHTVSPQFSETGALKGLPDAARIIKRCDSL